MDWFAIYNNGAGSLVSIASVVADPLPANLTAEIQPAGRPDLAQVQWDEIARAFVPRPPDPDELKRQELRGKPNNAWNDQDITDAKRLL